MMIDEHMPDDKKIAAGQFIKEKEYWMEKFSGEVTITHFPYDYPQKDLAITTGNQDDRQRGSDCIAFALEGDLLSKIEKLTKESAPKLHMVLMAGLLALLYKYTGSRDITLGTPIDKQDIEGEFTNTVLALRNRLTGGMTFKELLLQVRQTTIEAIENQNYPIEALVKQVGIQSGQNISSLFDVALLLENIHERAYLQPVNPNIIFSFRKDRDRLETNVEYKTAIFERATVERIAVHFTRGLGYSLLNPDHPLEDIDLLSEEEKQRLLYHYNNTGTQYPKDKPVYRLFEEQAEKAPASPALEFGDKMLTYGQLNEKKNRLAGVLRKKGAATDRVVGILLEKSMELVTAILGILKAGAGYLPLDIDYPSERKKYLLEDSGIDILLSRKTWVGPLEWKGQAMDIDLLSGEPAAEEDIRGLQAVEIAQPHHLAYIIYTSGSTGRPKGVMIEHRGLTNYAWWAAKRYVHSQTGPGPAAFPLYTSISFDLTVTSLFVPLITGNPVIIYGESKELLVARIIEENRVKVMKLTPTHLRLIREKVVGPHTNIRSLVVGGEDFETKLAGEIYRNFGEKIEIYNEYGPTEATVGCMIYRYNPETDRRRSVPIGTPADNIRIYILDKHWKPLPPGIPGEIYIGGEGVARGYLNRPELTAEKFCTLLGGALFEKTAPPHPPRKSFLLNHLPLTTHHSPIYRTGDLARWLPGDNLEFLGRQDRQIKIRGNRIELGEIENQLTRHPLIKEAVVTIRTNENAESHLCAYVVLRSPLGLSEIREYLTQRLPDYMMPTYVVNLETLPLNTHGKIDRGALPDPQGISIEEQVEFIPPGNPMEKKLSEVWEKVLGRKNIGINDNFFLIGGDSISSIRIIARMNNEGYKLEMRDLFQNPTIGGLAPLVEKTERKADQTPVTGTVPLTPVQVEFLTGNPTNPHHFNMAVMFKAKQGFEEGAVRQVFAKIQEHHDALRITFKKEGGEIRQINHGTEYPLSLEIYDLRGREDAVKILEHTAGEIQAGINLETGPLMKLGLFRQEDGDRLLMVVHHLVMDGVSWRIIFEDIATLMQQYKNGEPLALPLKSDSYKLWAEKLKEYADSPGFLKEKAYWAGLEAAEIPGIEKDNPGENNLKDTGTVSFALSEEMTRRLLTETHAAYGTEINHILLTGLALGIRKTWGHDRAAISLESHGRERIIEDIDITRTVGYYTAIYPVLLDATYENDLGRQVKEIKEMLRRVPHRGIGYGILRYLTSGINKKEIEFKIKPQVSFNYLGQFDADVREAALEIAKETPGNTRDINEKRNHELEISGIIANKQMHMNMTYSKKQYKAETVERLMNHFQTELQRVIEFCAAREQREPTPSDFTYTGLTIEAVDRISRQFAGQVRDVYRLSPMQEGMLFHAVYDTSSAAYFEQTSYRLQGELDLEVMEKSLDRLFERHDILRTVFVYEGVEIPIQVVLEGRRCEFFHEDLGGKAGREEKERYIRAFKAKDKQRGFDLAKDVLMRVSVIKLTPTEYEVVWSFHHVLMDGWCIGIINTEFFTIYNHLLGNREYQLPPVTPYRAYIRWLEKQDKGAAEGYWKTYLESYEEASPVPRMRPAGEEEASRRGYRNEQVWVILERDTTAALNRIIAKNHVTMNVVTQVVWGILLARYNGKEDVVFGSVVSGRPFELEGVETMVGLFINTIPVRIRYQRDTKFNGLLQRVQEEAIDSEPYHYHPLAEIQAQSELKQDLIDHIFIFENFPAARQVQDSAAAGAGQDNPKAAALRVSDVEVFEQSNYDFNVVLGTGDRLGIRFDYNGKAYDRKFVEIIGNHYKQVIEQIVGDDEREIGGITLLSEAEKKQILIDFNETAGVYPRGKTIHRLYAEQEERGPDQVALVGPQLQKGAQRAGINALGGPTAPGDDAAIPVRPVTLTYRELSERSGGLAGRLKENGVQTETIVGIMMERSVEMIIGILGILKAGGAYMPIDPGYPQERVDYMLKDSGTKILLTEQEITGLYTPEAFLNSSEGRNLTNDQCPMTNDPLAYVIYTSGTTGRPKGVMVEHGNAVRLVKDTNYITLTRGHRLLLTGNLSFDISTFEIWGSLLNGISLYLVNQEIIMEGEKFKEALVKNRIDILHLVPQLFNQMVTQDVGIFSGLRYFLVGGDRVQPGYVDTLRRANPGIQILHMYGPTENTTFSTYYPVDREFEGRIPIGKPIANSYAYVMDPDFGLQPVGVVGELWVGGEGVARGYLNNPELTAEKFDYNKSFCGGSRGAVFSKNAPLAAGGKLYRTGDLARWLPDGNLEFLGRADHQVKIRGIRIELAEIEQQLSKHGKVKDVVVIARNETAAGKKDEESIYLCAYLVMKAGSGTGAGALPEIRQVEELREFIMGKLPDYMVPAQFVFLEELPLTATGKIHRKLLPPPREIGIDEEGPQGEPGSEIEGLLVNVWKEVLGRERVGTGDNFFMIGGDSIKAIQIVARVKKAGYTITIREIFQQRTISQLAPQVRKSTREADQSVITGIVPLTPIQEEFFAENKIDPHHFNQTLMLYSKSGLDKEVIGAVFKKLQEHHDALRMTYTREEGKTRQILHGLEYPFWLREYELRDQPGANRLLEARANEIQAGIDLEKGPLMKLGLFHLEEGDRLLVVIHHLVMDAVSWRILLEDIETLYRYYRENKPGGPGESSLLPLKTDSYKYWAEKMQEYSQTRELLEQAAYWQGVEATPTVPLPVDHEIEPGQRKIKYNEAVRMEMDREETRQLQEEAHRAYNTEIDDLLLTALAQAIHRWTGQENILVSLEGHGREEIIKDMDITRTVGWFTTRYPIILRAVGEETGHDENLSEAIKINKEQRRAIPSRGIGYGILRYLVPSNKKPGLTFSPGPEISYNYLGEFGQERTAPGVPAGEAGEVGGPVFMVTEAGAGLTNSLEQENQYKININCLVTGGRFTIAAAYSSHQYEKTTMETLAANYIDNIRQILRHCLGKETTEKTLSDYSARMDQEELEDVYEALEGLSDD